MSGKNPKSLRRILAFAWVTLVICVVGGLAWANPSRANFKILFAGSATRRKFSSVSKKQQRFGLKTSHGMSEKAAKEFREEVEAPDSPIGGID